MTEFLIALKEAVTIGRKRVREASGVLEEDNEKLALSFFENILENSEAVILLIKSSHSKEAALVSRIAIEHLINMFATLKDKSHFGKMVAQANSDTTRTIKKILSSDKGGEFIEEKLLNDANAFLTKSKNCEEVKANFYNLSYEVGLGSVIYDNSYRRISSTFGHSTLATVLLKVDDSMILEDMKSLVEIGVAKFNEYINAKD